MDPVISEDVKACAEYIKEDAQRLSGKTLLITGAAGFLGSYYADVVSYLNENVLERPCRILAMDNFITGKSSKIDHLKKKPYFSLVSADVTKPFETAEKIGFIIHAASIASPIFYRQHPIETIDANVYGTRNMLELARKKGVESFVFMSSSEVYGDIPASEIPVKEDYRGNVSFTGPRACYSEDTKILTENGWKYFYELKENEKVATLNHNTKKLEYNEITEIIKERYYGQMVHFKNTKIDLLVTPNHNVYLKERSDSPNPVKNSFRLVKAETKLDWKHAQMTKCAVWKGEEKEHFYLPIIKTRGTTIEKIPMDIWLEFLGYYVTEGSHYFNYHKHKNGRKYGSGTVMIRQEKEQGKNKIRECLKKMPFHYFEEKGQFRIIHKQLFEYLKILGKAKDKYIPKEFKNLSIRQLKILYDALMEGDGSISKSGRHSFSSSSLKLVGDTQELAQKLGWTSNLYFVDKRKVNPVHLLQILKPTKIHQYLTPRCPVPQRVNYNGFVYCVNVPNHIILVQRNGKPLFCGNCYDESKRLGETLCVNFFRTYNVPVKCVRPFNIYGPRLSLDDRRVLPDFLRDALSGKDIVLLSDGSPKRSFCYVSDFVKGFFKVLLSDYNGEAFNIGNEKEEISMKLLAEKVLKAAGSSKRVVLGKSDDANYTKDNPQRRCPDTSKMKAAFGWEAKVVLDEGLKRTIDWHKVQK